jgi:phospholipid N-methyltransferase
MPDLDTRLHVEMLESWKRRSSLPFRILRAVRKEVFSRNIYGLQWGDPEHDAPLKFVKDRFVTPYINGRQVALEIGPGGGRWTRYLLGFKQLYVVDYYLPLLKQLQKNFRAVNMKVVKNNGCDFPGVPEQAIDYVLSLAVFVHLDTHLIHAYLANLRRVVKPGANIVIQYSDKTKAMARENPTFSANDPERMRRMVQDAGFTILEEDLTTICHSSIVRFTPAA